MRLPLSLLAVLAATSPALATEAAYTCADGSAVAAVFSPPGPADSVKLTFAKTKKPLTLPQAPSADGGRYAGGDTEFWIKGKTARLTRGGKVTECETR